MPSHYRQLLLKTGAALGLGLMACPTIALAADLTIAHAKGETVLSAKPKKVAVFDLATLDNLNAIGVDAIAGVPKGAGDEGGNFPANLARYSDARYQNVGTLFEPDATALSALKPDLIFVAGRSASKYDATSAIAPTIDMSSKQGLTETAIANTRKLGTIFGAEKLAEKRIATFEAQIARLHKAAASQGTGLLLFAAGQGAVVHAPGDRFGTLYDFVGIRSSVPPAAPKAEAPAARPAAGSPEAEAAKVERDKAFATALASEPDWLFVIDRTAISSAPATTIQDRLGADRQVTGTRAWQAGRVIYLDPKAWYVVGAGIDALSGSAEQILAAFEARR